MGEDASMRLQGAALLVALSGGYHVADGLSLFSGGVGDATLNLLFASLSVVLGAGLVVAAGGLFLVGSGGWFLAGGLVILCTLLTDVMSLLLRSGVSAVLDGVLLLAALALVAAEQSGDDQRADMDDEDSVHSLTDYP